MIDAGTIAGRYGAYIWPAYGLSLVGLLVLALDTVLRARRWRREADRLSRLSAAETHKA